MPLSESKYRVQPHDRHLQGNKLCPCRPRHCDGHLSSCLFPGGLNVPSSCHARWQLFSDSWFLMLAFIWEPKLFLLLRPSSITKLTGFWLRAGWLTTGPGPHRFLTYLLKSKWASFVTHGEYINLTLICCGASFQSALRNACIPASNRERWLFTEISVFRSCHILIFQTQSL